MTLSEPGQGALRLRLTRHLIPLLEDVGPQGRGYLLAWAQGSGAEVTQNPRFFLPHPRFTGREASEGKVGGTARAGENELGLPGYTAARPISAHQPRFSISATPLFH